MRNKSGELQMATPCEPLASWVIISYVGQSLAARERGGFIRDLVSLAQQRGMVFAQPKQFVEGDPTRDVEQTLQQVHARCALATHLPRARQPPPMRAAHAQLFASSLPSRTCSLPPPRSKTSSTPPTPPTRSV